MKKILLGLLTTTFLCASVSAEEPKVLNIDKYIEAIKSDRMNECISDNKVYSVGMIIQKEGERFVCRKFDVGSSHNVNSKNPASWAVKLSNN
ncbi:hypothetical protein KO519_20355 [Paraglaciecola agarilytica]|uniref:hypothetical protein n=1 Tax=Paraglaciecola chathamensis TaxID=368405 RepID=UPI001C09F362|nr:hypothetical protein [Paraglaciecola agarilytica]MBU3020031.1 hypothetical protein [Paraglaciecola agarilytica]